MPEKIVFTMLPVPPGDQPKHSTRFNFEALGNEVPSGDISKFKPAFYVPRPVLQSAKRIRVTLEEI